MKLKIGSLIGVSCHLGLEMGPSVSVPRRNSSRVETSTTGDRDWSKWVSPKTEQQQGGDINDRGP